MSNIRRLPGEWPLKKSFSALERDEEERACWRKLVTRLDADRLLFVDECGTHTSMTRTRARVPKGKRAYRPGAAQPWQEHDADREPTPQGDGTSDVL
jgi:hypothetical protein